ncbi:SDR family NAD(P)-dependent oxidoreductase [Kamptonema formosum]|uniref:SDR family NAD(P)-dependent oxidoreductase n=1 Tax=Kamptonema formosum TaxID=331992 RepID=UPI00034CC263|nr:SDR family oxidoreductase [Oscillatoria sp. PCC 10802]
MQTALITGASSGIGETFAWELAKRQTNLILVARSEAKLQQLAQKLGEDFKIKVEVLVEDLSLPGAAKAVFEAVTQKGLTVDLLVNNAGFGDWGAFADRQLHRQVEMIQLNIVALVELTHLFLPQMQQRRSGAIINVASTAAFQPLPYLSVYAASKAFVLSFSEALWAENRACGVRILAVCPGPTETNFAKNAGFLESAAGASVWRYASSEEVVLEALQALEKDQPTAVTGGLANQVLVNLPRLLPRETLVSAVEKQFRSFGTRQ